MSIFQVIGMCWVVFCVVSMSFGVLWFAFHGLRLFLLDAKAGADLRRVWQQTTQQHERVEHD